MSFMKNKLSYALWACFAVVTGFAYIGFMILSIQRLAISDNSIVISLSVLPVVFCVGIFLLTRWCVNRYHGDSSSFLGEKGNLLQWILLIALIGIGIFLRCSNLDMAGESAAYYESAIINGKPVPTTAHATQALYVYLLRGIFYLFGNKFMAGIVLQIVLQIIGVLLWHFALKKLLGNTAAFLFTGIVMVTPFFIKESLTYSANVLFFAMFGLALLCIGFYYKHLRHLGNLRWSDTVWALLMGVMVSILSFFDAIGLVLFVILYFVRHIRNKKEDNNFDEEVTKGISMQFGLHILGYFIGYIGVTYLDALYSNTTVQIVMSVGVEMFQPKRAFDLIADVNLLSTEQIFSWVGIAVVCLFGLPAFWMRRDRENQLLWFGLFVAVVMCYALGTNTNAMHYEFMVISTAVVLAGAGIQGILIVPDEANGDKYVPIPRVQKSKIKKVKKTKPVQKKETESKKETRDSGSYYKAQKDVQYIENPLPLPKKNARKSMGYKYEVTEDKMHYDIEVKEYDDFDI